MCTCTDTGFTLLGVFSLGDRRWVVEHAEDGARRAERLVVSRAEVLGVGNLEGGVEERENLGAEGVARMLKAGNQLGGFL